MSKVISGAKLELYINNIIVAYASNVSYQYDIITEDIREIDKLEVAEFAETGVSVSFTASHFRVSQDTAIKNGWQPTLGNILKQPDLIATIYNKFDANTSITVQGLKMVGRSGSIDARGVYTETLTFKGKVLFDEAGSA